MKRVDEAPPEQPLYRSNALFKVPTSWSPDGQRIVLTQLDPETGQNVWHVTATGSEPKRVVQTPTPDDGGPVSPDGRWLAFFSEETGRLELYVQPFPEPGRGGRSRNRGRCLPGGRAMDAS